MYRWESTRCPARLTSPITLGVILGLVVGKATGVTLVSLAGLGRGSGVLPSGVGRGHLAAAASLAGIGFTVSLFVAELAFDDPALREEAKIGVLAASALAAALGWGLFRVVQARAAGQGESPGLDHLEPAADARTDHHRGRVGAPADAGAIRRLLVPAHPQRGGGTGGVALELGAGLDVVFRHLPIEDAHADAPVAAEAAEAAGAQGRFWEMHDRLMADSDTLPVPELVAHADALDLDIERFKNDLRYHVHAPAVAADLDSARRSGAPGTPAFYLDGQLLDPEGWAERVRAQNAPKRA